MKFELLNRNASQSKTVLSYEYQMSNWFVQSQNKVNASI